MISLSLHRESLALIRNTLFWLTGVTFLFQCALDHSRMNLWCNLLCVAGIVPTCLVVFNVRNARGGAALTAVACFLNIFGNSLLPMMATLLEGHSVVYALRVPVETFTHRLIWDMILLGAHLLGAHAALSFLRSGLAMMADWLSIRTLITPQGIWLLTGIGILAQLLKYVLPGESLAKKFLDGFGFLIWAPYILLVPPYLYWKKSPRRMMALAFVFIIHMGMGMGNNSRMGIVGPVATLVAAWLVCLLAGEVIINKRFLRNAVITGLAGLSLVGQFQDLSMAMLITRGDRGNISVGEAMAATVKCFLDKKKLAAYSYMEENEKGEEVDGGGKVIYVRNHFLARFINIRSDDDMFFYIKYYTAHEVELVADMTRDRTTVWLPDPILKKLGIQVDKAYVSSFSTGDYMNALVGVGQLGYLDTGSVLANAYCIFGNKYPLVLFGMMFVLFISLQVAAQLKSTPYGVSTFAMIFAFQAFLCIPQDGLDALAGLLLRIIWQTYLIYGFVVFLGSLVASIRVPPEAFADRAKDVQPDPIASSLPAA